jgi:hypothetical protein
MTNPKTPNTHIGRIVEGLTQAQQAFVMFLPADGSWRETGLYLVRHREKLRGFGQSGLVQGYYNETTRHRLTGLGKSVRTYLEIMEGGR